MGYSEVAVRGEDRLFPQEEPVGGRARRAARVAALVLAGLLLFVVVACAERRTASTAPELTDRQRQLNVESFDLVWETIRDKHWDPELGGLDWPALREELRPGPSRSRTWCWLRASPPFTARRRSTPIDPGTRTARRRHG